MAASMSLEGEQRHLAIWVRDLTFHIIRAYLDGKNGRRHMERALRRLVEFCAWAGINSPSTED